MSTGWIQAIQWVGLCSGGIYIYLTYFRIHLLRWLFFALSAACIGAISMHHADLYFGGFLQIIYFFLSITLLLHSSQEQHLNSKKLTRLRISSLGWLRSFFYFFMVLAMSVPAGYLMQTNTAGSHVYLDAFASFLSLIALILVVYKYIDGWFYYIFIGIISSY